MEQDRLKFQSYLKRPVTAERDKYKFQEKPNRRVIPMTANDDRVRPMTPGENTDPAYYDPGTGEMEMLKKDDSQ
jgi:hypothetical protein